MIYPEQYTDEKKAYLTYDATPVAIARLLNRSKQYGYKIYKNESVVATIIHISKKFKHELVKDGFKIEKTERDIYKTIKMFPITNGDKIPVTVRKITEKKVLKQIRVRITASTHEKLMENTYAIRDTLAAYGMKHKLCVWDRSGSL